LNQSHGIGRRIKQCEDVMGVRILPWARRVSPAGGWGNDELAELYRVEHSLVQAGVVVETESGLSGDPWFVFCHPDGLVVVNTARAV
jgi:hypothetical protein